MNFNYNLPTNLLFGRGRVSEIGTVTAPYGKKALIVTGFNSTKKSGLLDRTIQYLKDAEIESVVFDQVSANPLTTTAIAGAELAKEESCDVVIGLGGGSIMDCAKAIAFLTVNEGDISDYIFNKLVSNKALPIILVPTTCGTGSEGNGFAVLTNPENGDKKSLRCNAIVAKASIIDSELMETMPKHILASVGFDALCHNMEAYISKISQPLTDAMSLQAMQLVGESLVDLFEGNGNPTDWDNISWASTVGGMVIHSAGVTVSHGMEHPASGLRNIVHGNGLSALTPVVMEKSLGSVPEKFINIAKCLGGESEKDCVTKIKELITKLELPLTLSEQGVLPEDIEWMVENCFKVSAAGIQNHPILFTREEIKEIYESAL
ncbi:MAG: iron-containing alcohol dehydrogenase [Eubacteriales bacterium]